MLYEIEQAPPENIDPRKPKVETFLKDPRNPINRNLSEQQFNEYLEKQLETRQFIVLFLENIQKEGKIDQQEFTETIQFMHRIAVLGGKRAGNYREQDVKKPGEFRTGYYYTDISEELMTEVVRIASEYGFDINMQVRIRRFSSHLNREQSTGYTNQNLVRNYPESGYIGKYFRVMNEIFNEYLQIPQGDKVAIVRKVAELHQAFAIAHPFEAVNQSLIMNMVNAMLEMRGIAGIPHGITDLMAMHLNPEDYQKYFASLVLQ